MQHLKQMMPTFAVCTAMMLCLATGASSSFAQAGKSDQPLEGPLAEKARLQHHKQTLKAFEKRVKEYCAVRNRIAKRLPGVSKESTPDEIEAHKKSFEDAVRKARTNLKPGYIFTKDIADCIRETIRAEFKGKDRKELRETALEAETQGVTLRVNYPYPEAKELTEMPPTLLLKLPQLPEHVKYRFVKRHLLLVDRENGLIVDYMLNALP
jgi:hypothetical protein